MILGIMIGVVLTLLGLSFTEGYTYLRSYDGIKYAVKASKSHVFHLMNFKGSDLILETNGLYSKVAEGVETRLLNIKSSDRCFISKVAEADWSAPQCYDLNMEVEVIIGVFDYLVDDMLMTLGPNHLIEIPKGRTFKYKTKIDTVCIFRLY